MTLLSSILYQFQGRKKILKSEEVEGKEKVLQLYSCQSLVGGYSPTRVTKVGADHGSEFSGW